MIQVACMKNFNLKQFTITITSMRLKALKSSADCVCETSVDLQKVKRLKYILLCKPHRDNIHPPMVHMLDIVHDHTPM